ncbi:MAG: bifunctional riboflavin kinase/FAD synthetase [Acidobacteriota bacterium]
MKDWRGPAVLTIGNFDGVHTGHRQILRRVVALARERGWTPSVLTFDPHPARVVAPERAPRLMTTPEQRAALMRAEGIEQILIQPFTPEFSRLSPEAFAKDILAAKLEAKAVLVGDNFRFGRGHAGDTHTLAELGKQYGFSVEAVPAVHMRGRPVSSSEIRRRIAAGDVSLAGRMLERCYAIEGPVVKGRGIGSRQTVPTLNLKPQAEVLPANGVYITRTADGPRTWPSVTNIGTRPTFEGNELTIETFLLGPFAPPTPAAIRVEFLKRLREERKFESPEALKRQILKDATRAQQFFRLLPSGF